MLKRSLDVIVSGAALVLLAPLLLLIAILILLLLGHPVFFRQRRPGWKGRPFMLVKFRTMTGGCDRQGLPLPDAQRLTPFGLFLRRSSLDELPELWNVLKGDMSLVGPRPLLMEYLPLYTPEQGRRHDVRPGLTGWAQIHGRNDTSWEARLRQDVWYVDHASFRLDLFILVRTFAQVISRRGVSSPGHVTMPKFEGTTSRDDAPQGS
jgi:lipopolysaccharide/colanic/teichoic acid biosynthesis glycosyltransferase